MQNVNRHKGRKPRRTPIKRTGAPPGSMNHLSHGGDVARRMMRDVKLLGTRSTYLKTLLDHPSRWSEALKKWRQELMTSLGGADAFTPEGHEVLARVIVTKLILDSVDAYVVAHPVVNKQKKRLFPIVEQRTKLVDSQLSQLKALREITVQAQQERDVTPISERLKALENGQED